MVTWIEQDRATQVEDMLASTVGTTEAQRKTALRTMESGCGGKENRQGCGAWIPWKSGRVWKHETPPSSQVNACVLPGSLFPVIVLGPLGSFLPLTSHHPPVLLSPSTLYELVSPGTVAFALHPAHPIFVSSTT